MNVCCLMLLFLFALLTAPGAMAQTPPTPGDAANARGLAAYSAGRYDEAAQDFAEAVAQNPAKRVYVTNWVSALGDAGRYAEAAQVLSDKRPAFPERPDRERLEKALADTQLAWAVTLEGQPGGGAQAAIPHARQAIAIDRRLRPENVTLDLNVLADLYGTLKQPDQAQALFREALTLARARKDRTGEANTLSGMADALSNRLQHAQAATLYAQAIPIQHGLQDRAGEAHNRSMLAGIASLANRPDEAIAQYRQAAALRRAENNLPQEASTLGLLADLLDERKRFSELLPVYARLRIVRKAQGDRAGEANALDGLAQAGEELGRRAQAVGFYQQALALRVSLGDTQSQLTTLSTLGRLLRELDRNAESLALLERALALSRDLKDRRTEGFVMNRLGQTYAAMDQYAQAADILTQSLAIRREVKDRKGEAATLSNLGFVFQNQGRYPEAIALFRQSLAIDRRDKLTTEMPTTLNNLATALLDTDRTDEAIALLREALSLRRKGGDRAEEATILHSLGTAYETLSRYAEATAFTRQALALHRAAGSRAGEAATLNGLGDIAFDQGRYAEAVTLFTRALAVWRGIGNTHGEAGSLNYLGVAFNGLSRFDKAISCHKQAQALFHSLGAPKGEAISLGNQGLNYVDQGRYALALDVYGQSRDLAHTLGLGGMEAAETDNMGDVSQRLGQYDRALELRGQALAWHRRANDRRGLAVSLNNVATVYQDQGKAALALPLLQEALPLARAVRDRSNEGAILSNLGDVYGQLGRADAQIRSYKQAVAVEQTIGSRRGEAAMRSYLADALRARKQYAEAGTQYSAALRLARQVGARPDEGRALSGLMYAARAQDNPRLAIFYGKQSVNIIQAIRSEIQALDRASQRRYVETQSGVYRSLAVLLIHQGRLSEAQQVLKLLKEEEFFDFLGRDEGPGKSAPLAVPAGRIALSPLEARWQARSNSTNAAQMTAEFRAAGERPGTISAHTETGGVAGALDRLGPGAVALFTILEPDKYVVIVVTQQSQRFAEYPIKSTALYGKIRAFRETLQNPNVDPRPLGQELYQILVGPIEKDLQDAHATTLLWSLDDALRYLPVAALYDGKRYFVERYRSEVFTLAGGGERLAEAGSAHWTALGLGVSHAVDGFPALDAVPQELAAVVRDQSDGAKGVLPGKVLLDEAFTQLSLTRALAENQGATPRFPVVHIASHFSLKGRDADSFLLLGDGGHLSVSQMKSMPTLFQGIDLLTLSACNTAVEVKSADGKEIEGFGALAQRLGARSVIASLWPVADAGTEALMGEFYRRHQAQPGVTKAEALRQAQLALLRGTVTGNASDQNNRAGRAVEDENDAPLGRPLFKANPKTPFAHPYYWAPFILIGNGQ
ncbi:MAG: tetratricopeptide repeat protein [Armatimonadota bacterium]|nr:tetratricopeptide repeat protein [Armatimonadota bacterium]